MADPGTTCEELYDFATANGDALWASHAEDMLRMQVSARSFALPDIAARLVAGGIEPIPAGDLVASFRSRFAQGRVGIFWDQENIAIADRTSGFGSVAEAVAAVSARLGTLFGKIEVFNLYCPDGGLRSDDLGGASHITTPHLGRVEVADKMILVDAVSFAFERLNAEDDVKPIVVIASCDSDFSALLSRLNLLGVTTVAITQDSKPVRSMRSVANLNLSFPSDFNAQHSRAGRVATMPRTPSTSSHQRSTSQQQQQLLAVPGPRSGSGLDGGEPRSPGGSLLPATPNSIGGITAPFPRSHSRIASSFGGGRAGSFDFVAPTPVPLSSMQDSRSNSADGPASSTGADGGDGDDDGDDLPADDVDALKGIMTKLVDATGSRRIQRTTLGQLVKSKLGAINLCSLIARAVKRKIVDVGGSGSLSWVGMVRNPPSAGTSRGASDNDNDGAAAAPAAAAPTAAAAAAPSVVASNFSADDNSSGKTPSEKQHAAIVQMSKDAAERGPDTAVKQAQAAGSVHLESGHPAHVWPPAQDPGTQPREFWLSYRLLKDRLNSQSILKILPSDVAPYRIVDTADDIAPEKFQRRAFGPFSTQLECSEFSAGLQSATWAAPRILTAMPTGVPPTAARSKPASKSKRGGSGPGTPRAGAE
jgi:hypothetical protein